jgi:hypothetical protein
MMHCYHAPVDARGDVLQLPLLCGCFTHALLIVSP